MSNKIKKAEQATEQKTVEAEQETPVNYDLLLNRIAELEKELTAKQPQNLDDAIKYFQEKQRKINELATFELHFKELGEAVVKVQECVKTGDFTAKLFRLSVSVFRDYDREGDKLFSVTNPLILAECMNFILLKVSEKIDNLKREIEQ